MGASASSPFTTTLTMPLYICVDCGGTKTAAVITDATGEIVGRGYGGPSNITYLPVEGFIQSVTIAVNAALKQAGTPFTLPAAGQDSTPFAAAWFGISGADSPAAIAKVEKPLSDLLGIPIGAELAIANDTHLLAAPVRMHSDVNHAVAVIAGTGSIAVGFKEEAGKIVELGRIGGWGWILGDEGGGYDVGRETLRHILLAQDKASVTGEPLPKSRLFDAVLKEFGVSSVLEIFGPVYQSDPSPSALITPGEEKAFKNRPREQRISSLPPLVFEAAFEHGDPLALDILKASAKSLSSQVAILLGEGVPPSEKVIKATESVVSFGGSLAGVEKYRNLVLDDLAQRGHVFKHVIFVDDAAATGAVGLSKLYNTSI